MHLRYPHIFSRVRLGPVELSNRDVFSPHRAPSLKTTTGTLRTEPGQTF